MDRLAIFCEIDDFCRIFEPKFNQQLLVGWDSKTNQAEQDVEIGSDDDFSSFSSFGIS